MCAAHAPTCSSRLPLTPREHESLPHKHKRTHPKSVARTVVCEQAQQRANQKCHTGADHRRLSGARWKLAHDRSRRHPAGAVALRRANHSRRRRVGVGRTKVGARYRERRAAGGGAIDGTEHREHRSCTTRSARDLDLCARMQRAVWTSKQEEDTRSVSMCGCGATRASAAPQYPGDPSFAPHKQSGSVPSNVNELGSVLG